MPLPKGPITIQVSPSTYVLMMKMIELTVEYIPGTNNLQFKGGVQAALDALYDVIVPPGPSHAASVAELQNLQQTGLNEASAINQAANYELVLPC
jgi:hypothetical protein